MSIPELLNDFGIYAVSSGENMKWSLFQNFTACKCVCYVPNVINGSGNTLSSWFLWETRRQTQAAVESRQHDALATIGSVPIRYSSVQAKNQRPLSDLRAAMFHREWHRCCRCDQLHPHTHCTPHGDIFLAPAARDKSIEFYLQSACWAQQGINKQFSENVDHMFPPVLEISNAVPIKFFDRFWK